MRTRAEPRKPAIPASPGRRSDGSLAQQIRRAATAAEAEELVELRQGLRSDVLGARRLLEEQQKAEAHCREELAELRDCVGRCRDEASAAEADREEQWLRLKASQEAVVKGYREGDRHVGRELLTKMSELNSKLGENMAALEEEVNRSVHTQVTTLREELERRTSLAKQEELEEKCSNVLSKAEASMASTLTEVAEASRKTLRTCRKEHEAFVVRKQKQISGWVHECQEQVSATRAELDGFAASSMHKIESAQEQEQRRWMGVLDSRLGRCEGQCEALLSDAKQHLGASEEMLQTSQRDGLAQQQEQRSSFEALQEQVKLSVEKACSSHQPELQVQRALVEQLATDLTALGDRLVVVEAAVAKQSRGAQSLRHKLQVCQETSSSQSKELAQRLADEVAELRRVQADSEATQVSAMEEKHQALRRHCRAWAAEAAQGAEEAINEKLKEVSLRSEASATQTQSQCRDWVDTALARLETLAVRTREQLSTFAEEVPFTVKRLLTEELGKDRQRPVLKGRRPSRPPPAGLAPQASPFELGDPLAPAKAKQADASRPSPSPEGGPRNGYVLQVTQPSASPAPPVADKASALCQRGITTSPPAAMSPPRTPSLQGDPVLDDSRGAELGCSPHAAG